MCVGEQIQRHGKDLSDVSRFSFLADPAYSVARMPQLHLCSMPHTAARKAEAETDSERTGRAARMESDSARWSKLALERFHPENAVPKRDRRHEASLQCQLLEDALRYRADH